MRPAVESWKGVTTAAEPWPLANGAPTAVTPSRPDALSLLGSTFRAHYVGLCRLAYLIVGDASIAEDIVQEAFLRTFAGWWRVREPERVHVYLRRAVINLSRSDNRSRGSEQRANARFSSGDPAFRYDADSEAGSEVVEAVRRLPDRQRLTVILRYYLDLPDAEVAEALGTSIGTVKSQLSKARQNLQRMLTAVVDD